MVAICDDARTVRHAKRVATDSYGPSFTRCSYYKCGAVERERAALLQLLRPCIGGIIRNRVSHARGQVRNLDTLCAKCRNRAGQVPRPARVLAEKPNQQPRNERRYRDQEYFIDDVVDRELSALAADLVENWKFENLPDDIKQNDERDTGETGILARFLRIFSSPRAPPREKFKANTDFCCTSPSARIVNHK
jgi:hypothetical protein